MMNRLASCAAVLMSVATAPQALAAKAFDLEGVAQGDYASVVVDDGAVRLTITPVGEGVVTVSDSFLPLIGRGVVTYGFSTTFTPKRFSFNRVISSITFNYGDLGLDDDNPVTVDAYSKAGTLLGSVVGGYDRNESTGRSITSNFSGASYFILSSGSADNNPNSLFWDVGSYSLAGSSVPEPATWALMILGFGVVGGALRRRQSAEATLSRV